VFELLIRKIPSSVENVPEELRKNNVDLYYSEKQDVNLDGVFDEWIIIIDDGIFVVFPDGQLYKTVRLEYFSYDDTSKYSQTTLKIEKWNGIQEPVLVVMNDQELLLTSIGENYETTWLGAEYDIANILFTPQDTPAQFHVFHTKPLSSDDYYDPPWEGYRWDPSRHEFRDDLFDYTLFVERNPEMAVEIANKVLPLMIENKDIYADDYWFPRYYYLCGLSYEFSGDSEKAAEIYWQIWHDFPESPYALMAQDKLEPINP
jgi:tetratricopeptide (TPR) repeat protein